MFGIGMPELLLILAVALIVLGPKKLPEMARSLGKALAELKKSTEELKGNLNVGDEFKDLTDIIDPGQYLETLTPNPPEVDQEIEPKVNPEVHPEVKSEVNPEVRPEIKPDIKPAAQTSSSSFPKASDV
jgi:Tat protein translocase TatB subunit